MVVAHHVPVFEDFQEVPAFRGGQDSQSPIVDDQHIHASNGLEDALVAAVATGQSKSLEHSWGPLIKDRPSVSASLMPERAGDPAFA
jgi:hypothetical protein